MTTIDDKQRVWLRLATFAYAKERGDILASNLKDYILSRNDVPKQVADLGERIYDILRNVLKSLVKHGYLVETKGQGKFREDVVVYRLVNLPEPTVIESLRLLSAG